MLPYPVIATLYILSDCGSGHRRPPVPNTGSCARMCYTTVCWPGRTAEGARAVPSPDKHYLLTHPHTHGQAGITCFDIPPTPICKAEQGAPALMSHSMLSPHPHVLQFCMPACASVTVCVRVCVCRCTSLSVSVCESACVLLGVWCANRLTRLSLNNFFLSSVPAQSLPPSHLLISLCSLLFAVLLMLTSGLSACTHPVPQV